MVILKKITNFCLLISILVVISVFSCYRFFVTKYTIYESNKVETTWAYTKIAKPDFEINLQDPYMQVSTKSFLPHLQAYLVDDVDSYKKQLNALKKYLFHREMFVYEIKEYQSKYFNADKDKDYISYKKRISDFNSVVYKAKEARKYAEVFVNTNKDSEQDMLVLTLGYITAYELPKIPDYEYKSLMDENLFKVYRYIYTKLN